jgi:hypothetical protein
MVDPQPSDSSLDSGDEMPKIVEMSSDSEVEEFVEFEPVMEIEPVFDIIGPREVDFEDSEADKLRK